MSIAAAKKESLQHNLVGQSSPYDGPGKPDQKTEKSWRDLYQYMTAADFQVSAASTVRLPHIWQGFKGKTTAHGLPHVDQSRGKHEAMKGS